MYLAVMGLYSRRITGYAMQKYLDRELVIDALNNAVTNRRPGRGLINSLRPRQPVRKQQLSAIVAAIWLYLSMSRKGDCWDNSPMESFFKTLKTELIYHRCFKTWAEAKLEIFEYIEVFYNRFRLHSSLGYATPEEFEKPVEGLLTLKPYS